MAEPMLPIPARWSRITMEACPKAGYIMAVDSGGTPSTAIDAYWDGPILWLTPKEVTGNRETLFVSRTERGITEAGLADSAARLLPPRTVMLTKRAPVGAVALNAVPMATNQGFLNFTCGPNLRPLYFAYWLLVNESYLNQVANGSTYRELYQYDLFEFEIGVPPVEEQDAILQTINTLQYTALLGLPLGQTVTETEPMIRIQEQTRRLIAARDVLIIQLLSGAMPVQRFHSLEDTIHDRHEIAHSLSR